MPILGLNVDFLPGQQQGLINDRGALLLHEVAISCTCRVEDTYAGSKGDGTERRREPFCNRCGGEGWLYRDPLMIRGIVTNIRQQRNILDAGIAQPGDLLLSPSIESVGCTGEGVRKVGAWDKLTSTWDQTLDDGQVIVRGAGTSAENAALKTFLTSDEDRLWYEPSNAVWCEDDQGKKYTQDADFTLGPGRIIKWVGSQPYAGQRYTLKYNVYYEWIAFIPPMERRDRDNKDLGNLVFLRKRHIVYTAQSPLATPDDKIPLQARIKC